MANCIRCGKNCNDGDTMCMECKAWFQEKTGDTFQNVKPLDTNDKNINAEAAGKKEGSAVNGRLIGLGVAAAAAVIVFAVVIASFGNKKPTESKEADVKYENAVHENSVKNREESDEPYEQSEEEDLYSAEDLWKDENTVHTYELIVEDVSWAEAYVRCLDRGGYLVRITSDEEYWNIIEQIQEEDKNSIKFWIGGYRAGEYEYYWAYDKEHAMTDGQSALNNDEKYSDYWLEGEPSFYDETLGIEEDCLHMFYMKSLDKWVWNDVPNDILEAVSYYSGTIGYICEYE